MSLEIDQIPKDIESQFEDAPVIIDAFKILVGNLSPNQLEFLTIPLLIQLSGDSIEGKIWLILLNHLVGDRYALFARHFALLRDDDSHTMVEIELEDYIEAKNKGYLEDPETGRRFPDFDNRVILYFSATERFAALSPKLKGEE